ncbi:RINT1-like protein MAG2L [Macadamia integrifolia]|uniref:RINT1-like protein MAG2L n=1 Tax=Macadamia integrifolia TaxID=60698 RepID=UPI001C4E7C7C|nr:RINT1-like protein MAG2L [Macadamia integrifolia]
MEPRPVFSSVHELPPHLLRYLDENFKTQEDLMRAPTIAMELKKSCLNLDRNLMNLQKNLSSLAASWISRSNSASSALYHLNIKLQNFRLRTSQDGTGKVGLKKIRKILYEELPLLAKEVRRIEIVRIYAETTLQLEALVGDLEDAVYSVMNRNTWDIFQANLSHASSPTAVGQMKEKLLLAVNAMNNIEDILVSISRCQPQWDRLLNSVDARVDKALAVLRPQALTDHRILLSSIGWPPPLLTLEQESEKSSGLPNPLVLMQGDKKDRYCESFLSVCALQHIHTRREKRKKNLLEQKVDNSLDLWTIEALVSPFASRAEHHFSKWLEQPKFMFALVYRHTRDFVQGVDDVLQPLIDKARLVGYSAKEAWVSAMVKMLAGYLSTRKISVLAERYEDRDCKPEVTSSWLHLLDLLIAFDKRMLSLASLGTPHSQENLRVSMLSIFCDRLDWLRIWAKIELKDAWKKLKVDLKDERAWIIDTKAKYGFHTATEPEPFLLSTRQEYKAPLIAEAAVNITSTMIERSQSLPNILIRTQFIRLSADRFLWKFLNLLFQHCKGAQLRSGYTENETLMSVSASINAARYCESVLREWSADVDFLEMSIAEDDSHIQADGLDDRGCFFVEQIKSLVELETDWLMVIITDLLQQFNTLTWEYVQNKEKWGQGQEQEFIGTENIVGTQVLTLSVEFVEALDSLRSQFGILREVLNSKDFLDLWRSVAEGLDHFIFRSILMSNARFTFQGASQFKTDMRALFLVFGPFCVRPEAFLPCIRDSMKLLEMDEQHVNQLRVSLKDAEGNESMHLHGITHISCNQAEKILSSRSFGV